MKKIIFKDGREWFGPDDQVPDFDPADVAEMVSLDEGVIGTFGEVTFKIEGDFSFNSKTTGDGWDKPFILITMDDEEGSTGGLSGTFNFLQGLFAMRAIMDEMSAMGIPVHELLMSLIGDQIFEEGEREDGQSGKNESRSSDSDSLH